MISSVIARLSRDSNPAKLKDRLITHSGIEVGELVGHHSLPIIIETVDADALECAHQWIRDLPGVEFVDVVSVFFCEESSRARSDATEFTG